MGPSLSSLFPHETLERLAATLGGDRPAAISRIAEAIRAHASKLQMTLDFMEDEGPEKEKRARHRAKLKHLRRGMRRWEEKLRELDPETRQLIRKGYGYGKRPKPAEKLSTDLAAIRGGLEGIIPALDTALEQIPGGRPSLGLMHEWAGDFATIYKECSDGKPFSYDVPPASTPGSDFVTIAVLAAFPNATEENLNTVLAGARPGSRKKNPPKK